MHRFPLALKLMTASPSICQGHAATFELAGTQSPNIFARSPMLVITHRAKVSNSKIEALGIPIACGRRHSARDKGPARSGTPHFEVCLSSRSSSPRNKRAYISTPVRPLARAVDVPLLFGVLHFATLKHPQPLRIRRNAPCLL